MLWPGRIRAIPASTTSANTNHRPRRIVSSFIRQSQRECHSTGRSADRECGASVTRSPLLCQRKTERSAGSDACDGSRGGPASRCVSSESKKRRTKSYSAERRTRQSACWRGTLPVSSRPAAPRVRRAAPHELLVKCALTEYHRETRVGVVAKLARTHGNTTPSGECGVRPVPAQNCWGRTLDPVRLSADEGGAHEEQDRMGNGSGVGIGRVLHVSWVER